MDLAPPALTVILLAAGRSERMGAADKLLLPLGDGTPLLRHAALLYLSLGLPLTVVLAANGDGAEQTLAGLPLTKVRNKDRAATQEQSAWTGLGALAPARTGVLIALADMPWLTGADVAALIATYARHGGARPVVPRYQGRRGNPVLLPAGVVAALCAGFTPPRAWLDRHAATIVWHESASDHVIRDIDTPADAATLKELTA